MKLNIALLSSCLCISAAQSVVSWDGLQHPAGWEPDCALRATGTNHVPGVCTQFYECLNGQPTAVVQNCGPGTYWHSELQVCMFQWQADCDAAFRQAETSSLDCAESSNCNASRSVCGSGSLFQGSTNEADLITCLSSFMNDIVFNSRTFTLRTVQNEDETLQFYEDLDGGEFIVYDELYSAWRIGFSTTLTHLVDCTTVPIC